MIYEVKDGDFVVLPKKLKMNGVDFDIIGIQENQLVFADSKKYYIDGKLLVEYDKEKWANEAREALSNTRIEEIYIEKNDIENMKSQLKKHFKDLPEPKFYYGKKIAKMEIVEKEDL